MRKPIINDIYICTMDQDRPVVASFTLDALGEMHNMRTPSPLTEHTHEYFANRGRLAAQALGDLALPLDSETMKEYVDSLSAQINIAGRQSFMDGFSPKTIGDPL